MRSFVYALAITICLIAPARAQQPGARIDVSRLGPQVGQVVPDFRLLDAQGASVVGRLSVWPHPPKGP